MCLHPSCSFALLPSLNFPLLGTSPSPSCHNHPAPLLLLRPLKETWSLKSAKRSTSEALKRPSAQPIVTETATWWKERRPSPAGEKGELNREGGCAPGPNEERDNCFVLLGALLQRGGSWNDTTHMVFGWSGHGGERGDCWLDAGVVKVQRRGLQHRKGSHTEKKGSNKLQPQLQNSGTCQVVLTLTDSQAPMKLWLWSAHIAVFNSQYLLKISMSKCTLITSSLISQSTNSNSGKDHIGPSWRHNFGCRAWSDLSKFMKQQTHESPVSWCSFNSWILRLTVSVPGFVAGVAAQTLLQNFIKFSVRERLWCELWVHLPVFLTSPSTSAHFYLFVCSIRPKLDVRNVAVACYNKLY